ncbi:MAG: FkbM family methyltransferase [Gallionella sp.]
MLSILEIIRHIFKFNFDTGHRRYAIDVGAHVGEFSKSLIDSGLFERVIAFEPNPVNAERLVRLASNEPRLTVEKYAVGATQGNCDFYCDKNTATGSLLAYCEDYVTDGQVIKHLVPITTLDTYCASADISDGQISLLKIDTQGHDLAVIQGASQVLLMHRPLVIAELIYIPMYSGQATPDEIHHQMQKYNYQLYTLFNIHSTIEGRMAYADALFLPTELDIPQSQQYVQLDNHISFQSQIKTLGDICQERLTVINTLSAQLKMARAHNLTPLSLLKRFISWVR